MTAPDPRLDEIQDRVDGYSPCRRNDDCGSTECQAERDAKHLLAELRKAHEALERVEALIRWIDTASDDNEHMYAIGKVSARVTADRLRAAVAAAKGDEQ